MRNVFRAGVIPGAMIVLLLMQPHTHAGKASVKSKHPVTVATGKHVAEKKPVSVQVVSYPGYPMAAGQDYPVWDPGKRRDCWSRTGGKGLDCRDREVRGSEQRARQGGARRDGSSNADARREWCEKPIGNLR